MSLRLARLPRFALMLLFASPVLLACQASPDVDDEETAVPDAQLETGADAAVTPPANDRDAAPALDPDAQPDPDPDAALPPAAPCPAGPFDPLPECTPALEGTLCYQSDCVRNATDQIGATYLCSNGHWDEAERGGWDCGPVQETCAELGAVPGTPCPAELGGWGCDWEVACQNTEPWIEMISCFDGFWTEPIPCE